MALGLGSLLIPVLTILFGIAVIVFPRFLRYIVGGYFILTGALALLFAIW